MATKADFTEEEWKTLQKGVTGAGLLVSVGDQDFTDSFGEASAIAKYLAAARQTGENELVRELANVRGTGFGMTASPQKVEADTLAALGTANEILAAKAPGDSEAYRRLVLDLARTVAEAKSGIAPGERAAIDKIKQTLGA